MMQRIQVKHWTARVVCLIFVPILVFMASFKMHFMVLNHSGPGDAQMSSLFQANLIGNDFSRNPLGVNRANPVSHLLDFVPQTLPSGPESLSKMLVTVEVCFILMFKPTLWDRGSNKSPVIITRTTTTIGFSFRNGMSRRMMQRSPFGSYSTTMLSVSHMPRRRGIFTLTWFPLP